MGGRSPSPSFSYMFRGSPNLPSGSPWVFLSINATALCCSHLLESSPFEEVSGNSSKSKGEGQGDQGSIKWLGGVLKQRSQRHRYDEVPTVGYKTKIGNFIQSQDTILMCQAQKSVPRNAKKCIRRPDCQSRFNFATRNSKLPVWQSSQCVIMN